MPPNTGLPPIDGRAFAAASSKPDVKVVRQTPDPAATASSLPATDAQTAAFARRAKEYPQELSVQADDQLLKLLKEESVPDLQSMAGLAPEDRELLSALMDSLTNFRNQLRQNNNMLFSKKIGPLVDLSDRLKSQAELSVPTLTFVTGALAYGVYTPMSPARFIAGKVHTAGVYYEVENFTSQLNENKMYENEAHPKHRALYRILGPPGLERSKNHPRRPGPSPPPRFLQRPEHHASCNAHHRPVPAQGDHRRSTSPSHRREYRRR